MKSTRQSQPGLAASYAIATALILPIVDAMVKWLVQDYPIVMVAWVRMGLISILLGSIGAATIGPAIVKPNARALQVLRVLTRSTLWPVHLDWQHF